MSEIRVTNWAGTVVYEARERYAPTSVEQVRQIVRDAASAGRRVRVVGTGHSFNDLADTDGVHFSLRDLPRVIEVRDATGDGAPTGNPNDGGPSVIVDGGATYTEVNAVLARHGLALANLASLPHITVAGAIATATHGSGDAHGSLASAVRSLTHVTPSGDLHTTSRGEPGFELYPVHLGLFGPVVALELDVVPAFGIATTVYERLAFDTAIAHLDDITRALYSFSLAPDWSNGGEALLFAKRRAGEHAPQEWLGARAAATARHPSPGADPSAVTEQLGRSGPSSERLTHFRSEFAPSVGDEIQSEYLVPRRHAADAMRALPQFAGHLAKLAHSMEIRTVAADDLPASPFHGTDALAIHITWRRDPARVRAFLPQLEAALDRCDARPHWGKVDAMDPARVRELFPGLRQVDDEARRHDPDGVFRNAWSERLFGNDPA